MLSKTQERGEVPCIFIAKVAIVMVLFVCFFALNPVAFAEGSDSSLSDMLKTGSTEVPTSSGDAEDESIRDNKPPHLNKTANDEKNAEKGDGDETIVVETKVKVKRSATPKTATEKAEEKSEVEDLKALTQTPAETVKYFCELWIKDEFKRMYAVLENSTKKSIGYATFKKRYLSDAETTLGLAGAKILDDGIQSGTQTKVGVELYFRNEKVPVRIITALLRNTAEGYRVLESGLIPIDMDDL